MMMTKEQAAQVWCPMVRITAASTEGLVHSGQSVFNRVEIAESGNAGLPKAGNCLADMCAMWRWLSPSDYDGHEPRGYCGLAGIPIIESAA